MVTVYFYVHVHVCDIIFCYYGNSYYMYMYVIQYSVTMVTVYYYFTQDYTYPDARDRQFLKFLYGSAKRHNFDVEK